MTNLNNDQNVSDPDLVDPSSVSSLRALIQNRKLTKETAESETFAQQLSALKKSMYSDSAFEVWISLSIAGRAGSVSKPMEKLFGELISERLSVPLPEFKPLHDGEDRWYLAKALQVGNTPEIAAISFSEIAREDVGEKARRVWVGIGFAATETRQDFLENLNTSIGQNFGSGRSNSDALAKRIRRIVIAIKNDLMLSDHPAGPDYSRQLKVLLTGHLTKDGPESSRTRESLANESLSALVDLVRLSLTASADPSSYETVRDIKDWWLPATPPREIDHLTRKIVKNGIETLRIFARQGLKNDPLRNSLIRAVGERVFMKLASDALELDSSLSEEFASWFLTGQDPKVRKSSDAIDAFSTERLNVDISRLLIYMSNSEFQHSELERVAEEIEDLLPEQGQSVHRFGMKTKQISQVVHSMCKSNHIKIYLSVGEIVQYDAAQHEAIDDIAIGANALVSRAGTRLEKPGKTPKLIIKPKVRGV